MCGRYELHDTIKLRERYHLDASTEELLRDLRARYNVAPTETMPIITNTGLDLMRWGLIPKWAKDEKIGYHLINARAETVFEKSVWKSIIMKHRCLVPANGFYEWQLKDHKKHPFHIRPKDQEIFSFAGMWESWWHMGREWHTYTILTTEPNKEMAPIHNRMPVILHEEDEAQWLAADRPEEVKALLHPYQNNRLEIYEISTAINNVRVDNARLIGPINTK